MNRVSSGPAPESSLAGTIGLHFLPGLLTMVGYVVLVQWTIAAGLPPLMGLLLATLLVMIPFELGYLWYRAKRRNGSLSMEGIVQNREPLPGPQYVIWPLLLFLWGFVSSALASPIDRAMREHWFSWLPSWFFVSSVEQFAGYSHAVLVTMFGLGIIVVGFAGPIVEELYFRGHLLPRLASLGRSAPAVHAVLFSLYHFWTPWQNVSRILLMVPMTYVVWWKRNIYLAMLAHCSLNAIVWAITFGTIVWGKGE
jgi:hypothetical protein